MRNLAEHYCCWRGRGSPADIGELSQGALDKPPQISWAGERLCEQTAFLDALAECLLPSPELVIDQIRCRNSHLC